MRKGLLRRVEAASPAFPLRALLRRFGGASRAIAAYYGILINHRAVCGNQFSVKAGIVTEKAYVYICPAYKGNVASDVKTGRIDHRRVCRTSFL